MSSGASVQLRKEFHVLWHAWAAIVIGLGLMSLGGRLRPDLGLGLAVYAIGAAALGALSIGQEFTWRTTATLLAQPVRRSRLGLWKVVSLASLLALLGAFATLTIRLRFGELPALADVRTDLWLFPLLAGLCLAPWLTMLSRSAIAGTVFTAAIPALLWIAGGIVARRLFGTSPDASAAASAFVIAFLRTGLLAICAIGAVAGWRMFLRLEAADDHPSGLAAPEWVTRFTSAPGRPRATRRRRHPLVALAGKELRLQELVFAVAALYALSCVAIVALLDRPQATFLLTAVTYLYGPAIALMAASSASAEERSLGVIEAQLLTPIPARVQWAMKVWTVAALSAILAIGLPSLLFAIFDMPLERDLSQALSPQTLGVCVAGGLYVSSVSQSRLRALMATPLAAAASVAAAGLVIWLVLAIAAAVVPLIGAVTLPWTTYRAIQSGIAVATIGAVALLALRFAARNHRAVDVPRSRIVRQILVLAGALALGATLLGVAEGVYFSQVRQRRSQAPVNHPGAPTSPGDRPPVSPPPGSRTAPTSRPAR